MRVVVCGGRDFVMSDHYAMIFHEIVAEEKASVIIHGGARGADAAAGKLAAGRNLPVEVFKADWSLGSKAGPMRNQRMIDEGKPDLVIAFPAAKGRLIWFDELDLLEFEWCKYHEPPHSPRLHIFICPCC